MQAAATTNLLYGSRDLPYAVSADLDAREEIARAKSRGCSCFTKATQQLRLAFHVVECTKNWSERSNLRTKLEADKIAYAMER